MIKLDETGDTLVVSGPYGEMVKIIPRLKGLGFRYNGADHTWSAPKKSLTDLKLKNLKKLINGDAPAASKGPEVDLAAVQEVFKELAKEPLFGFRTQLLNNGLTLGGDTYPFRSELRAAGGDWSTNSEDWLFKASTVNVAKLRQVFGKIVHQSHQNALRSAKVENLLSAPKVWTNLKIHLAYDRRSKLVSVAGDTRPLKDVIRDHLPNVKFNSSQWEVPRLATSAEEIEKLIEALDDLEAKASAAPKVAPVPQTPRRMENRRGQACKRCGVYVPPGEGYLVQSDDFDYDDEERPANYDVLHKDKELCDQKLAEARIRHEKARTIQQAQRSLRDLAEKREHYVEGKGLTPTGNTITIERSGYGSGVSVVIEPDQHHFWYIVGNSADGDDWSRNNIGGHSVGYRLPLTDEARVLIDVATAGQAPA